MENNQQGLYDERRDELTHYHAVGFRNLDISQNTQAQEAQPRGVERVGAQSLCFGCQQEDQQLISN